jgi:hypothetical protein
MDPCEVILSKINREVSLGYTKIHIYHPDELESGQVGYSVSQSGATLVGNQDGDWRKNWLVIGYDETCGDPIFIDTLVKAYPVFTAVMGRGRWDPKPVAISLEAFASSISVVATLACSRESPVLLEKNPISKFEREGALAAIREHNPGMDLGYWETILDYS